jgi:D-amino-acid oxidase
VREVSGREVAREEAQPLDWVVGLKDFRRCEAGELPDGCSTGWRYTAPLVAMPVYLEYLKHRLDRAGGQIELGTVSSLGDLVKDEAVAVNCTGFGAFELVGDETIVPIRGQLVVVDNPGLEEFLDEATTTLPELTYILPQGDHVILGGSAELGRTDLAPDPEIAEGILARCIALEPRLRGARVLEHRVGLRPSRPQVRLEHEKIDGCHLIHNYGHGGAGVTLSWGCAREVLSLVKELL